MKIIDNIDILLIKQTYSDRKLLAPGKIQQQLRIILYVPFQIIYVYAVSEDYAMSVFF